MAQKDNTTLDRGARRKTRTRHQLMDAVLALLLEQDYEEVMTDSITDQADVGRRTFYNHFINKRDCVVAALQARFSQYAEASEQGLENTSDRDEAPVVAIMARRVFLDIASDPITKRLMDYPGILREAIGESQRDYLTANLAKGLATHRLQPILPLESLEPIVNWGFVGLVLGSIERNSREQDSLAWTHFLLHNFGLDEADIERVLEKTTP